MNGASLLLQEDIRKQIGECLGSDYFVLPSSIHEVLILPDNGMFEVPELNAMVQEVNEAVLTVLEIYIHSNHYYQNNYYIQKIIILTDCGKPTVHGIAVNNTNLAKYRIFQYIQKYETI